MDWYAVRCVFRTASGDGLFEERVTLWRADSFDAAVERAEEEAGRYAADLAMRYHAPSDHRWTPVASGRPVVFQS